MRDLMVDFGDGNAKPLLALTDIEFSVLVTFQAAKVLILDISPLPGQNVAKRLEIERLIRSNPQRYSHNDNQGFTP